MNVFDSVARAASEREWDLKEVAIQPMDRLRRVVVCWVDHDMITGFFDLQVPAQTLKYYVQVHGHFLGDDETQMDTLIKSLFYRDGNKRMAFSVLPGPMMGHSDLIIICGRDQTVI